MLHPKSEMYHLSLPQTLVTALSGCNLGLEGRKAGVPSVPGTISVPNRKKSCSIDPAL